MGGAGERQPSCALRIQKRKQRHGEIRLFTYPGLWAREPEPRRRGVTPTTSPTQAYEELVRQFYVPFNTGDVSIYDRILAQDWIDDPLSPGQQPGPDGFKAKIIEFRQTIPGYHVTNDEILVAGNKVAVHSTVRSTLRNIASEASPTDRPFQMRTCDFHHIEHGKIVYTWHLEDFYGLFQHLGTLPGH